MGLAFIVICPLRATSSPGTLGYLLPYHSKVRGAEVELGTTNNSGENKMEKNNTIDIVTGKQIGRAHV